MAEYIVRILYRNHRNSRREMNIPCETLAEAQETLARLTEQIKADIFDTFVDGWIIGEKPVEQEQAKPTEPTHYKLTAKSISGGYYTAVLPITEDLDKAIDSMAEDLMLIGIERICLPVKEATSMTRTRLHRRLSNN